MTDEQIRLYALARTIVAPEVRIRSMAEPAGGGLLYTLALTSPNGARRWFAVHSMLFRAQITDRVLVNELRRVIGRPRPPRAAHGRDQ